MARKTPASHLATLKKVIAAWEAMRPGMSFSAMTLAQFKAAVQPCFDKRKAIVDARTLLRTLIHERNADDRRAWKLTRRVVNSVKGTPEEGEDGALYAAMGYVPWSVRHGRRRRKPKAHR